MTEKKQITIEINKNDIQDLIIQGTKEAIDFEVRQLRAEGYPVWVWKDENVVDATGKMESNNQTTGEKPETRSPWAGIRFCVVAIACFVLAYPIAGASSGIAVYFCPLGVNTMAVGLITTIVTLNYNTNSGTRLFMFEHLQRRNIYSQYRNSISIVRPCRIVHIFL